MNREELLKTVMKLYRYNLETDHSFTGDEFTYMGTDELGDYIRYEDLIDLINELYEQSK